MKILIYYEQYGYGGVDTHLAELINNWPEKKNKFLILTNPNNTGLKFLIKKIINKNVKILKLKNFFTNNKRSNKINFILYLFSLLLFPYYFSKIINKYKPDMLFTSNGGYPGGLTCFIANIVFKLKKKNSINLSIFHHEPIFTNFIHSFIANILSRILNFLRISIITVSKASKRMLEKKTPLNNIKIIYNGISIPKIGVTNLKNKKVVLGMTGPIDFHKGHDFIIDMFANSNFLRSKTILKVVGVGDTTYLNFLKKKIKKLNLTKNIFLLGFYKKNITSFLKDIDIYLMPTKTFEGFGYSMVEAMLQEKVVIASKVGAIPEIINNNKNGLIVKKFSTKQWEKSIIRLIKYKKLKLKLGIEGRKNVVRSFSGKKMSENFYKYIDKLNGF